MLNLRILGIFISILFLGKGGNAKDNATEEFAKAMRGYINTPPDGPTTVKLGIYVNNLYAISEQNMDYTMTMYFRQSWVDPRLSFNSAKAGTEQILVQEGIIASIWVPDTFFRNEKAASYHHITVPNRLMKVKEDGTVWYVIKITATFSCPMKFQKFPFDSQSCPMMFESFAHTMDTIKFEWLSKPDVDAGVQLPRFTLQDIITHDCSVNYTAGSFPCLESRFVLRRDSGFFITQIFIPSILVVILSWFSFWFSVDAVSARAGIGLTTVLTTAILSAWARNKLPMVSYITAMDIWMSACFLFVFIAFMEFAAAHYFSRRAAQEDPEASDSKMRLISDKVDKVSRILFPAVFLLFNIIYWPLYAS